MIFSALICLCLLLAGGAAAEAASSKPHVVIAHAAMNFRVAPLWVAQDQGFFAKYGIDSEIVFMRGGPTLLSGMMSGDIQIGWTASTIITPIAEGAERNDLRIDSALRQNAVIKRKSHPPESVHGGIPDPGNCADLNCAHRKMFSGEA